MTGLQAVTGIVGVWLSALLTIAVFSFLFKDNPLYRLAEHLVVGVSAGYTTVILVSTSLMDMLITPLWNDLTGGKPLPSGLGALVSVPLSTVFTPEGPFGSLARFGDLWLHLVPLALGIMLLMRLHPKASWVARYPIALFLGVGSGLAIPTALQAFVIQPLRATLLPVIPSAWQSALAHSWPGSVFIGAGELLGLASQPIQPLTWDHALFNFVIVAGTFCGIVYFFFSREHSGVTRGVANAGIWVLMVGFGSTFGFTVMSRVSLLVGRFEFLIDRWLVESFWRLLFPK